MERDRPSGLSSRLELELVACEEVAETSALAVIRVTNVGDVFKLVPAGENGVVLAPGDYFFEAHARATDGEMAPTLKVSFPDGRSVGFPLTQISSSTWRAVLDLRQAAQSLSMCFGATGAVVFGGASISTEIEPGVSRLSVVQALVGLLRAVFARLPTSLRNLATKSQKRARWLRRVRALAEQDRPKTSGGKFVTATNDAFALRADFENRLAVARAPRRSADEEADPISLPEATAARLIAYYLPQFHPIPENDLWWGKGFSEWSNVAKAQPQFVGHYQPHLPGELGFYDLRTPGVLSEQARLARTHGISAFCFHYYWFAGKRLLERPLESFLADPSIDIDFCLCWANENWTRRWDGEDSEILIGQSHTSSDHERLFNDIARHMSDPRYLKIEGKPVLVVYRPSIIDQAFEMTTLWRREAERRGWPGVYLIATNAFGFDDPRALGFDALSEFPPHGVNVAPLGETLQWINRDHTGRVFAYDEVARQQAQRLASTQSQGVRFPGVMPGWDNEARRPGAGVIYHGATPESYGLWLGAAIGAAKRSLPPDRRFVFINAWNEWAEGAHLEPDRRNGRAFLRQTARVLSAA